MRLPHNKQGVDLANGTVSAPWYAWFRRIEELADSGAITGDAAVANIAAICRALGSPDGTPETIPAQLTSYTGTGSVRVLGTNITLLGDQLTPSPTSYYGTDAEGGKGWQTVASALTAGSNVFLDTDSDTGVTTISADGGAGVPYFVPSGATWTAATNTQALFALPIELDGTAAIVIDGALVEVN